MRRVRPCSHVAESKSSGCPIDSARESCSANSKPALTLPPRIATTSRTGPHRAVGARWSGQIAKSSVRRPARRWSKLATVALGAGAEHWTVQLVRHRCRDSALRGPRVASRRMCMLQLAPIRERSKPLRHRAGTPRRISRGMSGLSQPSSAAWRRRASRLHHRSSGRQNIGPQHGMRSPPVLNRR